MQGSQSHVLREVNGDDAVEVEMLEIGTEAGTKVVQDGGWL